MFSLHARALIGCAAATLIAQTHSPSIAHAQTPSAPQGPIVAVLSQTGVVAADHPAASGTGAAILAQGGSAADAAIATLLTLGVVNPFASGLGGGGFCVVRDAKTQKAQALDFREIAPAGATASMYVVDGALKRDLSRRGGLAVGVPGEAAGLWALHQKYGKLPWTQLVQPAQRMAAQGFYVGTLLPKRLASKQKTMPAPLANHFKTSTGQPLTPHMWFKRPGLGKLLAMLAAQGPKGFYEGPVAQAIVQATSQTGGILTLKDLRAYAPKWRAPLKGTYRDYTILSMPPPSSGGVAIVQALNILSHFDLSKMGWAKSSHVVVEALKHVFADRARWLGDADFVRVPVAKLTSKAYAKALATKINLKATRPKEAYGMTKAPPNDSGTSHVSVVDAKGDMVACTSTVNTSFGSMVLVPGYDLVLNNEMDDFSAQPEAPNAYGLVGNKQNAIAPGKRPLSSMSPTLVLKAGEPWLAAGASGGPTIITGTLGTMLQLMDFGASPQRAVTGPRLHHQWLPERVYMEPGQPQVESRLTGAGHQIKIGPAFNSVQIVVRGPNGWVGVSDPRKHGLPAAAP